MHILGIVYISLFLIDIPENFVFFGMMFVIVISSTSSVLFLELESCTETKVREQSQLDIEKVGYFFCTCSGYYQRKSFGFSPEEPDASRSALESARYRSEGHRPSSFLC